MATIRAVTRGWTDAEQRALDEYLSRMKEQRGDALSAHLIGRVTRLLVAVVRGIVRPSARSRTDAPPARTLIVRLDELGDVILGSPLLTALRRAWPAARITLVVQPAPAAVYRGDPTLDDVLVFRPPKSKWLRPLLMPFAAARFVRELPGPIDLAIQPRWGVDANFAAWIAYFTGASRRVAFDVNGTPRKRRLNAGLDALYTDVIDGRRIAPEAERTNEILHALGIPSTPLDPHTAPTSTDPASIGVSLRTDVARVVVGVGGGHSALKAWPATSFGELMSHLAETRPMQFVLLGDEGERELAREALQNASGANVVDLVGRTSLTDATAILDGASIFVGNDTGLLHLAAARGVRCVGVFGSSLPSIFAPASAAHIAVWNALPCNPYARAVGATGTEPPTELVDGERCATCVVGTHACMRALPVADVLDACLDQLGAAVADGG